MPDAQWRHGVHSVVGDFGVPEWTFTGTGADGGRIEVDGVDRSAVADGKIQRKDVFRKARPKLPRAPRG